MEGVVARNGVVGDRVVVVVVVGGGVVLVKQVFGPHAVLSPIYVPPLVVQSSSSVISHTAPGSPMLKQQAPVGAGVVVSHPWVSRTPKLQHPVPSG